jgi:hypothetical protein
VVPLPLSAPALRVHRNACHLCLHACQSTSLSSPLVNIELHRRVQAPPPSSTSGLSCAV